MKITYSFADAMAEMWKITREADIEGEMKVRILFQKAEDLGKFRNYLDSEFSSYYRSDESRKFDRFAMYGIEFELGMEDGQ